MYCCCPPQTGRKTLRTSCLETKKGPSSPGSHHCNFLTWPTYPHSLVLVSSVFGEKPFLT